jgi:hypothetical protein
LVVASLLAPTAVFGCSLVYQYDVGQEQPDGGGMQPGDDATMTPDQHTGGDDAMTMTTPDVVDSGPIVVDDAEAGPVLPNAGVIVAGGEAKFQVTTPDGGDGGVANAYVLSVIDPTSGHELSREKMAVVGLSYDGVRDYWYIFEDLNPGMPFVNGPFAAPNDPVVLHVRQLETHTGKWTELGSVSVPSVVSADTIAPLNNRLAYISYSPADSGADHALAIVDTSMPSTLTPDGSAGSVAVTPLTMPGNGATPFHAVQIVGTRAVLANVVGGEVSLLQNTSAGGGGEFQFYIAKVAATGTTIGSTPIMIAPSPSEIASAGAALYRLGGPTNVYAIPGDTVDAGGTLFQFEPTNGNMATAANVPFAAPSQRFRPPAIAECAGIALVPQVLGTTLLAVPLAGGTPAAFDVTQNVANARFEPYSNSVIVALANGGNAGIAALTLGGTSTAPTLVQRTDFLAPSDLHPTTIAVRSPDSFTCTH